MQAAQTQGRQTMYSRRTMLKIFGVTATALASTSLWPDMALAWHAPTKFTMPGAAVANDMKDGKRIIKAWAPAIQNFIPEILGLNSVTYTIDEANDSFNALAAGTALNIDGVQTAATIGLFGTPANVNPNPYLSNYLYANVMGGTPVDTYTANIDCTLQGTTQFAVLDDSYGGVPTYMYHRPDIYLGASTASAGSGDNAKTLSEFVGVINSFDPAGSYYQAGDEKYNPQFLDWSDYGSMKYMNVNVMWLAANAAMDLIANQGLTSRYDETPADMAAKFEKLMFASQYAVLKAIADGKVKRKMTAVIGGISDQYSGVTNGVNLATGRACLDPFCPEEIYFNNIAFAGAARNTNVRYYQGLAAVENVADGVADVLGAVESTGEGDVLSAPVITDENGTLWATADALMQCDGIVLRTNTNVSEIPGKDELFQILREVQADESQWPSIFDTVPIVPGYGAANAGAYFWMCAYMSFLYPEVLNPAHMAAYICNQIYHIDASMLADVVTKFYGEMSLPAGYTLDLSGYDAAAVQALLDEGTEWYLANKAAVDGRWPNIKMTSFMEEYLTDTEKQAEGIGNIVRSFGENRYGTMAAAVSGGFATAETVVVATGQNYPDALAASGLAGLLEAPIITVRTAAVPEETEAVIRLLKASKAVIVGGEAAVSAEVEEYLKGMGLEVIRIAGTSRIDTANRIYSTNRGWGSTAIVAYGFNFPDALSASALAYHIKAPIFLTNRDKTLDEVTAGHLKNFSRVFIVGGDAVVDPSVDQLLLGQGISIKRLAGANRYATAVAIAQQAADEGASFANVGFATGRTFADALTGGVAMGNRGGVVLLADDRNYSEAVGTVSDKPVETALVFGGAAAVSEGVFNALEAAV